MKVSQQQNVVNQIVGECKTMMLEMLEVTKTEFEQRELTDDQKQIYSDLVISLAEKIMALQLEVINQG